MALPPVTSKRPAFIPSNHRVPKPETQVHAQQELDGYYKRPENVTGEHVLDILPIFYESLSAENDRLKKCNHVARFVRYLLVKISPKEQVETYLRLAEQFPLLNKDHHLNFERLWLLSRAYEICRAPNMDEFLRTLEVEIDKLEVEILSMGIESKDDFRPMLNSLHFDEDNVSKAKFFTLIENLKTTLLAANTLIDLIKVRLSFSILEGIFTSLDGKPTKVSRLFKNECIKQLKVLGENIASKIPLLTKWKHFHQEFHKIKQSTRSGEFSNEMARLLGEIAFHSHSSLKGLEPCAYEALLLGSFAQGRGVPTSDLDCAFLIEDKSKRKEFAQKYLPLFLMRVRYYLNALDDQWISEPDSTEFYRLKRVGCDIDEGELSYLIGSQWLSLPAEETQEQPLLVNTPEGMVEWMSRFGENPQDDKVLIPLPHSLFFAKSMMGNRQEDKLFLRFQELLGNFYQNQETRERLADYFIKIHCQDFPNRHLPPKISRLHNQSVIKNLKRSCVSPFVQLIFDIALKLGYANIYSVEDVFIKLKEDDRFSREFSQILDTAWTHLQSFRWKYRILTNLVGAGEPNELYAEEVNHSQYELYELFEIKTLSSTDIMDLKLIDRYILGTTYTLMHYGKVDEWHDLTLTFDRWQTSILPWSEVQKASSHLINLVKPLYLLHLCQSMLRPSSPSSISQTLGQILVLLKRRRMPLQVIPELNCTTLPLLGLGAVVSLSPLLEQWLINDYVRLKGPPLRTAWFKQLLEIDALFITVKPDSLKRLLEKILHTPDEDGWRLGRDLEFMQFCEFLKGMFILNEDPQDKDELPFTIKLSNLDDPFSFSSKEYVLRKDVRKQFINDQGKFLSEGINDTTSNQNHTTIPILTYERKNLWLKACPENWTNEVLAWDTSWRLGHGGVPPSMIMKLNCLGRDIALLCTPHIDGKSWLDSGDMIDRISPVTYSQSFLRVLTLCPTDDKPDDYKMCLVDNTPLLFRIDNDRLAFREQDNRKVFLKTILFCHDLIKKSLEPSVVQEFLATSPLNIARSLFEHLAAWHRLAQSLFNLETAREHFHPKSLKKIWNIKTTDSCVLSCFVTREMFIQLSSNLQCLHACCQINDVTGLDILRSVYPILYDIYSKTWEEPGDALSPHHHSVRRLLNLKFFELVRHSQGSSDQSLTRMTSTVNAPVAFKWDEIEKCCRDQANTPESIVNLFTRIFQHDMSQAIKKLFHEDAGFIPTFTSLLSHYQNQIVLQFSRRELDLNHHSQILLLRGLTQTQAKVHSFDLSPFRECLSDELCVGLFKTHGSSLLSLLIEDCNLITDLSIEALNNFCPNLTRIVIINCPGLTKISLTNVKKLIRANFSRCSELKSINLSAPYLTVLEVPSCAKLKALKTTSEELNCFVMNGCENLALSELRNVTARPFKLAQIRCERLFYPWQNVLLNQYPFLIGWIAIFSWKVGEAVDYSLGQLKGRERYQHDVPLQKNLEVFFNKLVKSCEKIPGWIEQDQAKDRQDWSLWITYLSPQVIETVFDKTFNAISSEGKDFIAKTFGSLANSDPGIRQIFMKGLNDLKRQSYYKGFQLFRVIDALPIVPNDNFISAKSKPGKSSEVSVDLLILLAKVLRRTPKHTNSEGPIDLSYKFLDDLFIHPQFFERFLAGNLFDNHTKIEALIDLIGALGAHLPDAFSMGWVSSIRVIGIMIGEVLSKLSECKRRSGTLHESLERGLRECVNTFTDFLNSKLFYERSSFVSDTCEDFFQCSYRLCVDVIISLRYSDFRTEISGLRGGEFENWFFKGPPASFPKDLASQAHVEEILIECQGIYLIFMRHRTSDFESKFSYMIAQLESAAAAGGEAGAHAIFYLTGLGKVCKDDLLSLQSCTTIEQFFESYMGKHYLRAIRAIKYLHRFSKGTAAIFDELVVRSLIYYMLMTEDHGLAFIISKIFDGSNKGRTSRLLNPLTSTNSRSSKDNSIYWNTLMKAEPKEFLSLLGARKDIFLQFLTEAFKRIDEGQE